MTAMPLLGRLQAQSSEIRRMVAKAFAGFFIGTPPQNGSKD
jgi:hypothetical protein